MRVFKISLLLELLDVAIFQKLMIFKVEFQNLFLWLLIGLLTVLFMDQLFLSYISNLPEDVINKIFGYAGETALNVINVTTF